MKDRKTLLILWIPFLVYLFAAGGYLLHHETVRPEPISQYSRREAVLWRPEEHLVDLNRGTLEELQTLPGIGETKAGRIVEYRERNGAFRSVEELLNIQGIGEKMLEELKAYVYVEE